MVPYIPYTAKSLFSPSETHYGIKVPVEVKESHLQQSLRWTILANI
jgi:hypothetical protein